MTNHFEQIFGLSADIRYVALYRGGKLSLQERDGLSGASESESDKYEELLVNPTVLKLVSQRGNIDCGGVGHVVIGYGNFQQLVVPLEDGHVSVAFEHGVNPVDFVTAIKELCN